MDETQTEPRPGLAAAIWPRDQKWPVSVEAISWALNLASVPADRVGQLSSACTLYGNTDLTWEVNARSSVNR
ncbi:MAG: hypothetical protein ACM3ML_20940 [Micromonosporaceae bacterium]